MSFEGFLARHPTQVRAGIVIRYLRGKRRDLLAFRPFAGEETSCADPGTCGAMSAGNMITIASGGRSPARSLAYPALQQVVGARQI